MAVLCVGSPGWMSSAVMGRALAAVSRAADDHNVNVVIEELTDPRNLSRAIANPRIQGAIIYLSSERNALCLKELARRIPLVRAMGDQCAPVALDQVSPNNRAVGYLACTYLIASGCRNMAFVSAHPDWDLIRIRAQGFIDAVDRAGATSRLMLIAPEPLRGVYGESQTSVHRNMESVADALLAASPRPSGIFVARDSDAYKLYPLLTARGPRIGTDITVVSCDNDHQWLEPLHPRPASIDLNPEEIGRRAFLQLLNRIDNPGAPLVQIRQPHAHHASCSGSSPRA